MRIMMLGDVVGPEGVDLVRRVLPAYRRHNGVDFVVANGENSARGNGILPRSANALFLAGCDVVTTGNHGLRRKEIYDYFGSHPQLIRPANYHPLAPGAGSYIIDRPPFSILVINLQGVIFMDNIRSPFETVDEILRETRTKHILVDFHAEATSEKLCMGFHLDGRVSVVAGTHTHVATADERVLPGGTAYITDLGMCGGRDSVLGVRKDLALSRMLTHLPTRFENESKNIQIHGIIADIDDISGKASKIERIELE